MILVSGQHIPNMPTIFDSLIAPKGMLFNMGFIVHNYDNQFNISKSSKEIKAIWSKAKGPLAAFVSVQSYHGSNNPVKNDVNQFMTFIKDYSLGSSMSQDEVLFGEINIKDE